MKRNTVSNQNAEQTTSNDASQPAKEKIVACHVVTDGKPTENLFPLAVSNIGRSIGEYCSKTADSLTFVFNGCDVTIPSGKSKDGKERFFMAAKGIVEAIFNGLEQTDTPKDETHLAIVSSLQKIGYEFADNSRLSVFEGVNIRLKNYAAKVKLSRNVTREMATNKVWIQETNTANKLNRIIKADGLGAALTALDKMKKEGKDAGIKLLVNS